MSRRASARVPSPRLAVSTATLSNGLRVVLSPDRSASAVAVALAYDVGFRSEPPGRTGFAHLFEHLMFEGSENVPKLQFDRLLAGNGGENNGWTRSDFTFYFDIAPPNVLELMLFLEADRMRALTLTEQSLRTQVAVVKEEVLTNVFNRPYGGFPWLDMPQVAFTTFPNAHNFYGEFADLDAATLDDATDFYRRYYAPSNAVLANAGSFQERNAAALVERYFASLPSGAVPPRPSFDEPLPTAERRLVRYDSHAPEPALAVAFRTPDPQREWAEYLAFVLGAEVLTDGEACRLVQRLVKERRCATFVEGEIDLETRGPALFTITAHYSGRPNAGRVLRPLEEELARFARDGPGAGELERFRAASISGYLRGADDLSSRVYYLAVFGLLYGRPELVNTLPQELAAVTTDAVRASAQRLDPSARAVVDLRPGRERPGGGSADG